MATALEAGYDLGAIALCFLAIGSLLLVKGVVRSVAGLLDFNIFGYRPFHTIASALENGVVGALDDAIKGVEKAAAKFESGLIDSFGLLIAIPLLLGLGIKAALEYLWDSALKPTIRSITDPIKADATSALAKAAGLAAAITASLASAEKYARGQAASALASAEALVETRLSALELRLGRDIAGALSAAEGYADLAVGRLRAAEDAAVAGAVGLAAEAKLAGELAGRAALLAAEAEFAPEIAAARAAAAAGLAELDAAGKAALAGLEGVVINVGDDLAAIEGAIGAAGVGALIASIPAIATLVHAIATESGLENADCRSKVKGICGTNPSGWGDLLAGLAALGFAFSLRELVEVAQPLVGELAGIIDQAA